MHGVKRGSRATGATAIAELEHARAHAEVLRRALASRTNGDKVEAWNLTAAAVELHPDEYSVWNWRRTQLCSVGNGDVPVEALKGTASDYAGGENVGWNGLKCTIDFETLWQEELALTMRALRKHPKAYPCWQHRLWLLSCKHVAEDARFAAIAKEKALSGKMLAMDGRNFHGWAHRLRVRAISAGSKEEDLDTELKFARDKIDTDFANYSAWHVRSKTLPVTRKLGKKQLSDELDFVRQAFYTEPDVQSAWFYHRWLLAGMPSSVGSVEIDDGVWERELEACDELLELETDARWVLHGKAHILAHLGRTSEAVEVYKKLGKIDGMRRGFYKHRMAELRGTSGKKQ